MFFDLGFFFVDVSEGAVNESKAVLVLLQLLTNEGKNEVESGRRADQGAPGQAFDETGSDGGGNADRTEGEVQEAEEAVSVGAGEDIRGDESIEAGVEFGILETVGDDEGEETFEGENGEQSTVAIRLCQGFGKKKRIREPRDDRVVDVGEKMKR